MRVIPALHHLEILALRERLNTGLNTGLSHWQARVQGPSLEEFASMHALLLEGVRSIRAGREWILALLIGFLMGLREDATQVALIRAQNHRQLEPRKTRFQQTFGANHALRYQKSCVLWSRYLG